MNRRKLIRTLFVMTILVIWSAVAVAHNGIEHVMGTVTAVTDTAITVDTVKHTTVTVLLDLSTTFRHKDVKAALKDVRVGERVVINAKEATGKKLKAISVRWGASSNAMAHGDHKM